ncbi:hypothetical protein [Sporolactobacillus sp. THM19-2]|uniref:hypothetical protein n=1 Tax=Sporolactobacillus sp. THM19-2 TaxID=2511171 RepID=UPI00102066EB|nr:hypothetical protein [Sporolactobacillus sp. THM19-2]RYL87306.1 hypothetical protein EWH91_13050 [Sporolactobacillus sp. THM19-2]
MMFISVGIPMTVLTITQLMKFKDRGPFATRLETRFQIFHIYAITAVVLSFVFTVLILMVSWVAGGLMVGFDNTWLNAKGMISQTTHDQNRFFSILPQLTTYKVLGTLFVTKFLGFLMIAFLTLFLKNWFKNDGIVLIVLVALAGVDQLSLVPIPIFTLSANLWLGNWLNPMTTFFHCAYLLIVSIFLYGITGILFERRDFLS